MVNCSVPGSTSFLVMCSRLLISSSCGAWITMVVEPRMLSRQPSFPCRFNRSVRKYEDSTALQWHLSSATVTPRHKYISKQRERLEVVFTWRAHWGLPEGWPEWQERRRMLRSLLLHQLPLKKIKIYIKVKHQMQKTIVLQWPQTEVNTVILS